MVLVDFHPKLSLTYSQISDGNMDDRFSPAKEVRQNRTAWLGQFKLHPRDLIEAAQIHSDRLLVLNPDNTKMWRGVNVTGVDGFVSRETDVGLLIKVADCVPLVIFDPSNHALGLFHVGFKGAVKGIHTTGLTRMTREFQTDPREALVWLGPSARRCHYQVSALPEDLDQTVWADFLQLQGTTYHPDLTGFLKATLKAAGIKVSHITDSGICTIESNDLYSHQRSLQTHTPEGRIGVVAKLN